MCVKGSLTIFKKRGFVVFLTCAVLTRRKKTQRVFTSVNSNVLGNSRTLSSSLHGFEVILTLGFRVRDRCLK